MRVYGLKAPGHHFGWLISLFCFGLAILYPPLPGELLNSAYASGSPLAVWNFMFPGGSPLASWHYVFFQSIPGSGGIAWQLIHYIRWQTYALTSWSGRTMFVEFAPFSFVPIILPVCVLLLWQRLVTNAIRTPTIWRGLASVLLAFVSTGALIFLLDQVGGRVFLHIVYVSLTANLEVRELMDIIWLTSLGQLALFLLPLLALGGGLARYQQRHETRPRSRPRPSASASQGIPQGEKA
jgi:hypothetical protein